MNKINRIKLAKAILNFGSIQTDKGELIFDGEMLAIGAEVFVEDENAEIVVAPDGEYKDDNRTIVVEAGVVTEIREESIEEVPAEEVKEEVIEAEDETPAEEDPKDARIAELEALVSEKDEYIAELEKEIEELKNKAGDEPVEEKLSKKKFSAEQVIKNPALKYFM